MILLLLLTVGLPRFFDKELAEQRPLLIEFETIADKSMAPILKPDAKDESTDEAEGEEAPKPEPIKPDQAKLEETKPQSAPAKPEVPKPTPSPKPVTPEPEPVVEPEPTPEPAPVIKKPEKKPDPKPEKKPEKKPEQPKKVDLSLDDKNFDSLLKDLDKEAKKQADKKKKTEDAAAFEDLITTTVKEGASKKGQKKSTKGAMADAIGPVMTGTEIDAVRRTIARCWIVPNGARGSQDMTVDIQMKIDRDGTVQSAEIPDKARYKSDPVYRAAADSGRRAVLDPRCNPLPLSPEKYEQWKDLTMSFNPRDMY